MPVVNKDKYLSHIAGEIGRRAVYFEKADRPEIAIGDRRFYMDSISFDTENGKLTYSVCDADGNAVLSNRGTRLLEELTVPVLREAKVVVDRYAQMHRNRNRNIVNIASMLASEDIRRKPKGLNLK